MKIEPFTPENPIAILLHDVKGPDGSVRRTLWRVVEEIEDPMTGEITARRCIPYRRVEVTA